jgi:hypothetical protein
MLIVIYASISLLEVIELAPLLDAEREGQAEVI